jgi:hypothetical protein
VSDDKSHPKYLPRDLGKVRDGMIPTDEAVEYESEEAVGILAGIPEGAIIPGMVAAPAVGDRGDVSCTSRHDNGRWQLYIRRKLDTAHKGVEGRPTDVTFEPGGTYPFGCAAFDNTSKRHSYGLTPFRLVLKRHRAL